MGAFNCGAFVAGIVKVLSILVSSVFFLLFCLNENDHRRLTLNEGGFGWCWLSSSSDGPFCTNGTTTATSDNHSYKVC